METVTHYCSRSVISRWPFALKWFGSTQWIDAVTAESILAFYVGLLWSSIVQMACFMSLGGTKGSGGELGINRDQTYCLGRCRSTWEYLGANLFYDNVPCLLPIIHIHWYFPVWHSSKTFCLFHLGLDETYLPMRVYPVTWLIHSINSWFLNHTYHSQRILITMYEKHEPMSSFSIMYRI